MVGLIHLLNLLRLFYSAVPYSILSVSFGVKQIILTGSNDNDCMIIRLIYPGQIPEVALLSEWKFKIGTVPIHCFCSAKIDNTLLVLFK